MLQLVKAKNGAPLLSINRQQVVWAELQRRLLEIYKSRPHGVLFIDGDADVDFE